MTATTSRRSSVDAVLLSSPGGLAPGHQEPVIIAHRGACGYRPEHTLPSYELAARMGADYVSVDLVPTRDGHLVARHESELSATTDISRRQEHSHLRTIREIEGYLVNGWFAEDLTLQQIKSLRATERLPHLRHGSVAYDGLLDIPTLEEVLALRSRLAVSLRRPLGLYLHLRTPRHFRTEGLDTTQMLLDALRVAGLDHPGSAVVVLGEDIDELERLRLLGAQVPLHLRALVGEHGHLLRDLARTAELVSGLSPDKQLVIPRRFDGSLGRPTGLVADAHAAGLVVHPWTFRAENVFLPDPFRLGDDESRPGRASDEIRAFLAVGIDGFCTDHTDRGVLARRPDDEV